MNSKIAELFEIAGGRIETENGNTWTYTDEGFDPDLFAQLIAQDCALTAGLMEQEGRKMIGAQILSNYDVNLNYTGYHLELAESLHSDKGYSLGTQEAQEAFDSKRGYKL